MIFILNKQEKVVNILRNGGGANQAPPFFDDIYAQDLATGAETFSFSTIAINNVARDLVVGNYVAFKNEDGEYKLFQITQTEEYHEDAMYMNVYAEGAGLELINKVFRTRKAPSTSLRKFMEMVLDDTGWNVGAIPFSSQESLDLDLPDATVYSTLQTTLGKYGVEMAFRCEINNGRISSKFIDLYTQRGRVTGKRFSFGRDIEGIKRKVDSTELFTALIGRGNKDISFKDVTVSGIDKPLGQDFVADQEAYDRYNNNGYHIIGIFKYDTDSPEELLRETYKQLEKCKEPKIEYEVSVALLGELLGENWNKVRIGDTVAIVDNAFNPPIHLMARVSKLEKSFTDNQSDTCTLANFIEVQSNITDEMRRLASELEGYVEGAIDNKFPIGGDDIKEGAINGSHIYKDVITTDHLIADAITADKIKANQITTKHLQADSIKSEHISAEQIEAGHIKSGTITADKITSDEFITNSAQIKDGIIGTAQIGDAEITVAKIQDLFVDDLVANQGKFQSAHIGVLTSDNIDAKTIKAEHITASVIDAINMSVSGKIDAEHIDVNSLVVDELDAGKITTGTLDADRITSSVITAINASIENATIDSAKIGELSADKITSGEISTDILKSNIITAINASLGKISADHIDVDSIKVENIDASQITTGDLDADRITASVISAINSYAGTMKIKQGQIETLQVGSANITDLDVSKLTGDKINAKLIDVDKIIIKDANITGTITASKISGGTLDASKMTVKNLNADSITTGSITLNARNILENTMFNKNKDGAVEKWLFAGSSGWSLDEAFKYNGYNTMKFEKSGLTANGWNSLMSNRVRVYSGQTFIATWYIYYDDYTKFDDGIGFEFDLYSAETGGTRLNTGRPTNSLIPSESGQGKWIRHSLSGKIPSYEGYDEIWLTVRTHGVKNGRYWVALPMFSLGSIAGEWTPHTNEMITSGAIDNDKIADEAISSNKLNIEELFVGENAFIKSLKAVEIDASNITTGTISGERIDMKGLIAFEALEEDLQKVFDVTGDKTYINGGMIATNTIKANSIDLLSGLTVRGEDNTTTFAIASNGDVEVNGLLRSGNFDMDKNTGYRLSTDGKAILNQAVVKGDVILPSAGMTNYGGQIGNENLALGTVGGITVVGENRENQVVGIATNIEADLIWGKDFTVSFEYEVTEGSTGTFRTQTSTNHYNMITAGLNVATAPFGKMVVTKNFPKPSEGTTFTRIDCRMDNFVGTLKIWNFKIELGNIDTPWCPHKEEQQNYVRIWAGTNFENRNNAKFRVYDNGDVFATDGTFSGKMYGALEAGLVHISNNEIVINSTSTYIDEDGMERSVQPLAGDSNPYVRLGAGTSTINTDLVLGDDSDKKVIFSNGNRELTLNSMDLNVVGLMTDVTFNRLTGAYGGLNLISKVSDGHHVLRHSSSPDKQGTMVFDSEGSQGEKGDFSFARKNYAEEVKVDIDGSLLVKSSISSSKQNIEMRSVANEGWGFYAT